MSLLLSLSSLLFLLSQSLDTRLLNLPFNKQEFYNFFMIIIIIVSDEKAVGGGGAITNYQGCNMLHMFLYNYVILYPFRPNPGHSETQSHSFRFNDLL
jgi:hypothetical protein